MVSLRAWTPEVAISPPDPLPASEGRYRQRLAETRVTSAGARRLQQHLLSYHDFRQHRDSHPLKEGLIALADWQTERLKRTHADLYRNPDYHQGLVFLLTDLYAPAGMTRRDDNIDRIFPRMVRWLPEHLLQTFDHLVTLNLHTQRLDLTLLEELSRRNVEPAGMSETQYCDAFRACSGRAERLEQINRVSVAGHELDRYVRNRTLGWLLSMSRTPAEMADLEDLHDFLYRGYQAFQGMAQVQTLINRLVAREQQVLERIFAGHPDPFRPD